MDDRIEQLFKEIIWQALVDLYADIASWTESQIETKLKDLASEVGKEKPLSSSPLVRVSGYAGTSDPDVDEITFLIRGRVPLFLGVESVFMRVEVTITTEVDLTSGDFPIEIVDWITIVGDLTIKKKNVFEAKLGLGYDDGIWKGRGAVKILPAGFGLDLYLGGLSDRGAMIGLGLDLPAPIPLGATGLGISGMGGDFAYNFIARLEKDGLPVVDPTAEDYVRWARNTEVLDRWEAGDIEKTSVGVGVNTDLVTVADNGHVVKLEPIGLAVLTPGPVFVLGGVGKLLSTDSARVEGYVVVDIPSKSLALGFGVRVMIPKPKSGSTFGDKEKYLVDASGVLDAFFSFEDGSSWYVNLGTKDKQIAAKILADLIRGELYFMIDHYRLAFGAGISIGGKWKWWIITLVARVGAKVAALIGWNPVLLEGMFGIWGELGLKVWKFGFILRGEAEALGHTPDPTKLDVTFRYKLDLPWPIPDIKGDKTITLGDETPAAPSVSSPLLAGSSMQDGIARTGTMKLGLLHALTGRQWDLGSGSGSCWPDVEIVAPFSRRATDRAGVVVGKVVGADTAGGYDVQHDLEELKLFDISGGGAGVEVSGLKAVWTAGPDGDTARLHVNGEDPFSWVVPHGDVIETVTETPGRTVERRFGRGPDEIFTGERRFGEMLVTPLSGRATLLNAFGPALAERVLDTEAVRLRFATRTGDPVEVEQVTLLLLSPDGETRVKAGGAKIQGSEVLATFYGSLRLVAVTFSVSPVASVIEIDGGGRHPLLIYAVRYREARETTCNWTSRVVLKPGRYRISLSGSSKATYPDGSLPDSATTTWSASGTFDVGYPETLRPYIKAVTLGDNRIFSGEASDWNPTMHGFGFPSYTGYVAAVRFLVPYMDEIFPQIRMRVVYETGEEVVRMLPPIAGASGDSALPEKSRDWIARNCGATSPDQEIALPDPFPKSGPAAVVLSFDHPDGKEVRLDSWSCIVSRFASFSEHLVWPSACLTVAYGPAGRAERPCCLPPGTAAGTFHWRKARPGNRIDTPDWTRLGVVSKKVSLVGPLLELAYPADHVTPFPEELSAPPASWRLPASMSAQLGPLDGASGYRYARFAALTGARLNGGGGDMLDGLNDTVEETTVEAVTDASGRPFALWLRTPEPLDWRRVSLKLSIRHVKQTGDCPEGYAHRERLDLNLEALPSPDASAAFLVGSLAGQPTRLPRGEYELEITFDPDQPGLEKLRPRIVLGPTPERVVHTFIQPLGEDWPLPSDWTLVPAGAIDRLATLYGIDWTVIDELIGPRIGPQPGPWPEPPWPMALEGPRPGEPVSVAGEAPAFPHDPDERGGVAFPEALSPDDRPRLGSGKEEDSE